MKRLLMVGAGVSTVSLLKNLRNNNDIKTFHIDIIDSQTQFGRGNAYIHDSEVLMSNVPVKEMSLDDDEMHLADWLDENGIQYNRFCSRRAFGQYMHETLMNIIKHNDNINYKYGIVDNIDYDGELFTTTINGTHEQYNYVYLGIGMLEYVDPYDLKGTEHFIYNPYPLNEHLKNVTGNIAIIGSGLSGIDCLRYLIKERSFEKVYMFSRDKDLPAVRGESHTFTFKYFTDRALEALVQAGDLKLNDVKALFIKEAQYQGVDLALFERKTGHIIEDLTYDIEHPKEVGALEYFLIEFNRVFTKYLHRLIAEDQTYLMENYQPYIAENYSPMPKAVAEDIIEWLLTGRLIMVDDLEAVEKKEHFILKTKEQSFEMDVVINATGPNNNIESSTNSLIQHLLKGELIMPHHLGGFKIDQDYLVVSPKYGTLQHMFALGELTFGMTYLSTAVFDIYEMTKRIAEEIKETI